MIAATVEELTPLIGTRPACRALGASAATIYRRRRPPEPRTPNPRPARARALQRLSAGGAGGAALRAVRRRLAGGDLRDAAGRGHLPVLDPDDVPAPRRPPWWGPRAARSSPTRRTRSPSCSRSARTNYGGGTWSATRRCEPCGDERTPRAARRSRRASWGQPTPSGRTGMGGKQPRKRRDGPALSDGLGPASETEGVREKPASERLSRADHQLESGRSGLGSSAHPRLGAENSLAGQCRRPGGHGESLRRSRGEVRQSWSPNPTSGSQ